MYTQHIDPLAGCMGQTGSSRNQPRQSQVHLTNTLLPHRNEFGKRQVKIAIEYRIEEGGARNAPYIYAFLVMYDQNGHRRSVIKNGSWGCHGEDMMEFKLWFAKKLNHANEMQEQRIENAQESITDFLS